MTHTTHRAFNFALVAGLASFSIINPIGDINGILSVVQGGNNQQALCNVLMVCGVFVGGLLPDIDNPNSRIRNLLRPQGFRGGRYAGGYNHRNNVTHWPLFWLLVLSLSCTSFVVAPLAFNFLVGVSVGVAGHLICDLFNPFGLMLFAPFSKKHFHVASIQTNSVGEIIFKIAFLATSIVLTVLYLF